MPRYVLLTGLAGLLSCASAGAETSVGIVSDYRYRGLSLTGGQPSVHVAWAWDGDAGGYAGVVAAGTEIGEEPGVQLVSYTGRGWRLQNGRSIEAGVQYVAFSRHRNEDYAELYVGALSDRWSMRAYYQPEPLGDYGPAAYVEGNLSRPVGERILLFGHVGAGWRGGPLAPGTDRTYLDGRIGVGMEAAAFNFYVQYVAVAGRTGYLAGDVGPGADASGWVVGLSRSW